MEGLWWYADLLQQDIEARGGGGGGWWDGGGCSHACCGIRPGAWGRSECMGDKARLSVSRGARRERRQLVGRGRVQPRL